MGKPGVRRNIFQRLLGICATKPPADEGCWTFEDGKLVVDLSRVPELAKPNGAVRLEPKGSLAERVLLFQGADGQYHAVRNRCAHAKRRLDPVPEASQVQCCSVGKSTYNYEGKVLSGLAGGDIRAYPVELDGDTLLITLSP